MHMKTKYENCILFPMHIAIHYVTTNTSTHTVADPEYLHPQSSNPVINPAHAKTEKA